MNKQEVIDKIEASKYSEFIYEFDGWKEEKMFNRGLDCALFYVKQLDESEETVAKRYKVLQKKSSFSLGVQQQDGSLKDKFTKDELKEYGFDNLDEYEVEEVEG